MRVKFRKGMQRKFLFKVLKNLSCPSLRSLNQYGVEVNYSTLKNYFTEERLLPEDLFFILCDLSKLNKNGFSVIFLDENWGQVLGGKQRKRNKFKR